MVLFRRYEGRGNALGAIARGGLLLACLLVAAPSQGGEPKTSGANRPGDRHHHHAAKAAPEPPSPLIIKVEPSAQEVHAAAEREAAERQILGLQPEAWMVIFSGLLVAGTGCLWWATIDNATAAKRAAEIAGRALTDLERPYIFIHGIHGVEALPQDKYLPRLVYNVSNNGKLAAKIEDVRTRCGLKLNGIFPPTVVQADHLLLQRPIMSADDERMRLFYELKNSPLITKSSVANVGFQAYSLANGVIFQVVIRYRGPSTKDHETAQCWEYNDSRHGWFEIEDPKYTYMR